MVALKTDWEIEKGIKFSKRGIIEYVESMIEKESMENDDAWNQKLKSPTILYYIRKGGSSLNPKAPYMRQEMNFAKPFKM
jgi:hypothetical protein